MGYIMKFAEGHVIELIQAGKRDGYIRNDIDDNLLYIFMTGVSMKFKEYIMNQARTAGQDIVDQDSMAHDNDIRDLMELLKTGMGEK
jgi:hypothetical protein